MARFVMQCLVSPETEFWEIPVFDVNDKHILVTGGSSGLGRHFSRFLAYNGAKITLAARRAEALTSAVAEIKAAGDRAQSVHRNGPFGSSACYSLTENSHGVIADN